VIVIPYFLAFKMCSDSNDVGHGAPKRRPCVELLDDAMVEVLRGKTKAERLAMVFAANRTMRLRLEGHLRSVHPDWDTKDIMWEIARRWLHGDSEKLERDFPENDAPEARNLDVKQ
jgi:hypothetical protein